MSKGKQVVTIKRDGSVEGLHRPKGFDMRKLGEVDINRASEVMWSKSAQKHYVIFYEVSGSPFNCLGSWLWEKIETETLVKRDLTHPMKEFGVAYFDEYEQAVEAEIKTLDYLRINGLLKGVLDHGRKK